MTKKREGANRRKLSKHTKILSVIILGLVLGIGAALALVPISNYKAPPAEQIALDREPSEPGDSATEPVIPPPTSVRPLTVLVLGVDSRPGEPSISNTDTLIVAQVNPQTGQIALLSVPRDTQVEIPRYGIGKINMAARVGGGLNSTKNVLEKLLGLKIDGYVLTDFAGFKDTIDALGGITLTVEKDMYYDTGDQEDGIINLKQGTQRLNGTQALQYARFRQDALADISRTMRQQAVLRAAAQEFLQLKTLPKLPKVIPRMMRAVKTDLSLTEMLAMANVMVRLGKAQVISQTLPGNFVTEKGISYWRVNSQESQQVACEFFSSGKTVDVFSRRVASQVALEDNMQGTEKASVDAVKQKTQREDYSRTAAGDGVAPDAKKNLGAAKNGVSKEVKAGGNEQALDADLVDGISAQEGLDNRLEQPAAAKEPDKTKRENPETGKTKLDKAQDGIVVEVEILSPS